MAVESTTKKALNAKKAVAKGTANSTKTKKIRTTSKFHRPKTLIHAKNPKVPTKSVASTPRLDSPSVVLNHSKTEGTLKLIEQSNTLVLEVAVRANKHHIKKAVKDLYQVEALKVNTLIKPNGTKKAFVRLTPDHDALDVASRVGYF